MGMTGILLIAELMFDPNTFYLPNLFLIGLLVGLPILISPETLNAQLIRVESRSRICLQAWSFDHPPLLVAALLGTVILGLQLRATSRQMVAISMLVFMDLPSSPMGVS